MNDASMSLQDPFETTPAPPGPDPSEARAADSELDRLLLVVKEPLCQLAILVHRIRDRQLYKALSHESFEGYIASKQLQFSRSFVFQLAKVGKMLEASGIDLVGLPDRDLEITKLAQIARLTDPDEQRRVVETGFFSVDDQERPLREIPVRELTGHVDRRLGREPRAARTLSETYDNAVPWNQDGQEESFVGHPAAIAMQSASFQEMRISAPSGNWSNLLEDLASAIRPLSGMDRDDALNALSRLYQELVGF